MILVDDRVGILDGGGGADGCERRGGCHAARKGPFRRTELRNLVSVAFVQQHPFCGPLSYPMLFCLPISISLSDSFACIAEQRVPPELAHFARGIQGRAPFRGGSSPPRISLIACEPLGNE
jgi:hypothetical protein